MYFNISGKRRVILTKTSATKTIRRLTAVGTHSAGIFQNDSSQKRSTIKLNAWNVGSFPFCCVDSVHLHKFTYCYSRMELPSSRRQTRSL